GLVLDQFRRAATDRRTDTKPVQQRVTIPAMERILVNAAFASERVRDEILPQISHEQTASWVMKDVFEAMRQAPSGEGLLSFSAVEGRLSAQAQALLHEAVAADDYSEEAVAWEQAQACLRRLSTNDHRRRVDELRAKVKAAEREGRVAEALKLMVELDRLERENRGVKNGDYTPEVNGDAENDE